MDLMEENKEPTEDGNSICCLNQDNHITSNRYDTHPNGDDYTVTICKECGKMITCKLLTENDK